MYKIWCRNNLGAVGKWGGASFLFGFTVTAFMFVPIASQSRILDSFGIGRGIPFVRAYVVETAPIPLSQPTQLKLDLNSVSKLNDVVAPLTNLINNAMKSFGLSPSVNTGTRTPLSPIKSPSQGIDFSKFFSSSNVSSTDVLSFLKQAAITGINLFILVISITSQVLKGLLSVFK